MNRKKPPFSMIFPTLILGRKATLFSVLSDRIRKKVCLKRSSVRSHTDPLSLIPDAFVLCLMTPNHQQAPHSTQPSCCQEHCPRDQLSMLLTLLKLPDGVVSAENQQNA